MDAPLHQKREVSCLALTFFYDFLESRGLPRSTIQSDLAYPPAWLDDRLNWIDFATFLEIERRVGALFPGTPNLFYEIGLTFAATKGLGFIRVVVRGLFSPYHVYARFPTLVERFLFPFVKITITNTGPNRVRARYVFAPEVTPSEPFLDTVRGILAGVPAIMGAPPGNVRITRVSLQEAIFDIEIAQWQGLGERVRGLWRRMSTAVRVRWLNLTDAATELEEANRLLQEKVEALTEAKQELDRKVRNLTVLNALARAATGELDARAILKRAATAISEGLEGAPVALLIADGDQGALVVAADCGLSGPELRELRTASQPDTPVAARLNRGGGTVRISHRTWSAVPMRSHERLVGGMLIAVEPDRAEPALFESMASQLAVSVENALSYRVIADLRDHLEIRVRERTAELEEARTKLEDTVTRLEQSDRAKALFFTNVSHELRTPLTLIVGPLEDIEADMATGRSEEDVRPALAGIRRNALHLLHLVNEMLDFAKLDAGAMPMQPADMEICGLVDEVVATLRPIAERKGIALRVEFPNDPLVIMGDKQLLRRVVVNLLANALKYARWRDQVTVRAYAWGEEVLFEVQDTGPGIAREEHARIFERFARASQHAGGPVEGSGIGLAMAQDIVHLHSGTIELESEVGKGSLFRVRLPAGRASAPVGHLPVPMARPVVAPALALDPAGDDDLPTGQVHVDPASASNAPAFRHQPQVVLVEDNPEMREFLVRILARDHQVRAFADGREALPIVVRDLPDIVVTDVMMAGMGGIELCRRLKDDVATRNIPVILVSARHGSEAVLHGFAAGADDYVTKPFSPPELVARVSAQIRIRSLATTLMRMEKQYSLGVLSAGIAHEMLNPVNAVINAVPPLRKSLERVPWPTDRDATRTASLLDAVEASGRRMHHVVKGILAYTRQEATPRPRSTRLSEDIEAVLEILRYRTSDVSIHRAYTWDEPVMHFPEWLDQVIMNLLVNALDAMPDPRRSELWITTERVGDSVYIRIRDAGPGVPPELRERIFTPFFTTKPPGQGTGLGLAISREIVAMHRGTLSLNPAVPTGAEFVVALPLERSSLAMEA